MGSGSFPGDEPVDCDRCEDEIPALMPATSVQFSGGVDAHRLLCYDCITDLVEVYNEGRPEADADA